MVIFAFAVGSIEDRCGIHYFDNANVSMKWVKALCYIYFNIKY